MNIKLTYYGHVNGNGELKIYRRKEFLESLKMFLEKDIEITIKKKRRGRSLSQNSYYWAVVVPMVWIGLKDAGWQIDFEQTHELLKYKFLLTEVPNVETGEVIKSIGSTTKLSTSEMMDYISQIQQWAAEYLNVYIPDPGEQVQIYFEQ